MGRRITRKPPTPSSKFDKKVAVITGAASGIGRAGAGCTHALWQRRHPAVLALRARFAKQVEQGLDPLAVGRQVARAMNEELFYILTHTEWMRAVEHHVQEMLRGANPSPLPESITDALFNPGRAGSD